MGLMSIVMASALVCQPVANEKLMGLWESESVTSSGVGSNIVFRKDGSFTTAMTVIVDLKYQVKDGKLYIAKDSDKPVSFDIGLDISFEKGALVIAGKDGKKETKYRVTPKIDDPIVGIYKYRHNAGGTAYERYTPDGMLNFRLPLSKISGCFKPDKKQIRLEMKGGNSKTISYSLSGGKLIIGGDDDKSVYNRVVGGTWYDSENIDYKKPLN